MNGGEAVGGYISDGGGLEGSPLVSPEENKQAVRIQFKINKGSNL